MSTDTGDGASQEIELEADDLTEDDYAISVDVSLREHDDGSPALWPHPPDELKKELHRILLELLETLEVGPDADHEAIQAELAEHFQKAAARLLADAGHHLDAVHLEVDIGGRDPLVHAVQLEREELDEAVEQSAEMVSIHAQYQVGGGTT
jgi:hypothetical protein